MAEIHQAIRIPVSNGTAVDGDLVVPNGATGLVVFAHGSGSSRHSSRNRAVAAGLRERGLATLLMDLLTAEEEATDVRTRQHRFDIGLLARRLQAARRWVAADPATEGLAVGYFGASTGAGAALVAAADDPGGVTSVVSRGGRPDLAGERLGDVEAPTLLIVGGRDEVVIELNKEALAKLKTEAQVEIVPGATHLFEEAGALDSVSLLAGEWFVTHFVGARS